MAGGITHEPAATAPLQSRRFATPVGCAVRSWLPLRLLHSITVFRQSADPIAHTRRAWLLVRPGSRGKSWALATPRIPWLATCGSEWFLAVGHHSGTSVAVPISGSRQQPSDEPIRMGVTNERRQSTCAACVLRNHMADSCMRARATLLLRKFWRNHPCKTHAMLGEKSP